MSTPTPPPRPPLTLSPRPAPTSPAAAPASPVDEPEGLPTFGTTGVPLATALLRLGVPLLVVAAVVVSSLASPSLGLILGGLVLLAGLGALGWQLARGRGGRRAGAGRLGRALGGTRLGRALRSAGGRGRSGLARARNGRFASRLRSLTGGRFPAKAGAPGGRRTAGGLPGASRRGGLLGKARGLLSSRSGARSGGSRSGGRSSGGSLGRFLPRGVSGARSAHGSTGRSGGRSGGRAPGKGPGKGGSKGGTGGGSTSSRGRGRSLLNRVSGGRLGSPGTGGGRPSGGRGKGSPGGSRGGGKSGGNGGGKGKGGSKGGSGGGSKGHGSSSDSSGAWRLVGRGARSAYSGFATFVGNQVRAVDGHAVADALRTPFKPGPPKKFTTGIDEGETDPMPDWWPGQTADDYVWPGQSTVDDYAWPRDHDKGKPSPPPHPSPHASPHPPEQHEHHESHVITTTRRDPMTVAVTDFANHFENLTEESTAAERKNALNEAASDASARHLALVQEAERLRADARAAAKFPDRVTELNAKAAALEGDAEKNRLLSAHFTSRSAEQAD